MRPAKGAQVNEKQTARSSTSTSPGRAVSSPSNGPHVSYVTKKNVGGSKKPIRGKYTYELKTGQTVVGNRTQIDILERAARIIAKADEKTNVQVVAPKPRKGLFGKFKDRKV